MSLDWDRYPHSGDILDDAGHTLGHVLLPATYRPAPAVVDSPEWWLQRLISKLVSHAPRYERVYRFYEGHQPLAFASDKWLQVYGPRFGNFPSNFMPLVVGAEQERLIIDGFRFGSSPESDKTVWRIWQDNQLDAESQIAHEIALAKGCAYIAVDPTSDGPSITIEDPSEVYVETAPGNRRNRLAAVKVFIDDDGFNRAYVYLPDNIYRYRSTQRRTDTTASSLKELRWEPYADADNDAIIPNRLGVVPIIPLVNRPLRDGTGRSEISSVVGNQLAINFLRYAALIGSDVSALPQRWAKNLDIPVDPDTGKPLEPFRTGRDNLWVARRPTPEEQAQYGDRMPEVEFGQFPAASLMPFVELIREELSQMSSISRTPWYYLMGQGNSNPPAAEQTKTSEAPLVRKSRLQAVHFGEGWEEAMRVALIAIGQKGKAARSNSAETIWADFETRNEAAHNDAVMKQYEQGLLPEEFVLEELGYSPQQIARIKRLKEANPSLPQQAKEKELEDDPQPPPPQIPDEPASAG